MNFPLVSILMTVYNRENFISQAIESVLALDYTNWELIVVDDRSSDRSLEIAELYGERDSRIKIFSNENNLGDYPNRNKAALYANGKYLKYLDSDDIIYSHGLKVMVSAMEANPDAALGLSQSKPEDEKPYPILLQPREVYLQHFLGRGVLNCGPSGSIIRREVFEGENGFQIERFLGDTELWLRIACKYPILKIPPALIWWRKHDGQEIRSGTTSDYYAIETFRLYLNFLRDKNCPLQYSERKLAIRKLKQHHARKILRLMLLMRQFSRAAKIFKASELNGFELLKGFRPYI